MTVAPLTRTARGIPTEVSPADGVPTDCVVSLDDILTISKALLGNRTTTLSAERMAEVFEAVRFAFEMP